MRRIFSVRALVWAAVLALLLLPLVAVGGTVGGLLLLKDQPAASAPAEVDAVLAEVTQYTVALWDVLPKNTATFADGLTRLAPGRRFAVEIRSLDGAVLYTSPEAPQDGPDAAPAQRAALVRKDGTTLGLLQLRVWPAPAVQNARGKALAGSIWAGTGVTVLILAGLLWFIRRALLQPLRALVRAADAVTAGAQDFPVPDTRVRELATLGRGFAALRDQLQLALDRQQALETEMYRQNRR